MMKHYKIASSALTLILLTGSAAFADGKLDQLFKDVKNTVTEHVSNQVNKLTGNQPAAEKVAGVIAGQQFTGRFATASGDGMDVFVDFAKNGLYRRKDIYVDHPDETFLEMGTWKVENDGTVLLMNTYGESQPFTLSDKEELVLKSEIPAPKNILKKGDFDLFEDRHFLVDLDKTLTVRNAKAVITLSGDGTYRYAEPAGNKTKTRQGLWTEVGSEGLILLRSDNDADTRRILPMKKGFVFADDEGNPMKGDVLNRTTEVNLFEANAEVKGTLERDAKGNITLLANGMRYEVDSKKSNLNGLTIGKSQNLLMKVTDPADDDDLAEAVVSPLH